MDHHFTYGQKLDNTALKQGDILEKSEGLKEILGIAHKHYQLKENYTHFQVLTQSCDLAKRAGRAGSCSARYITLAAVRPLQVAIGRALTHQKTLTHKNETVANDKDEKYLTEFLKKVLNNNNKEYFYLKSESEVGLDEDSCTFLYLTVAIKAKEHYETCLKSKILELNDVFRAKLGWMVGNLYARVGTEDWTPSNYSEEAFEKYIKDTIEADVFWIPQQHFSLFKSASNKKPDVDIKEIIEDIKEQYRAKRIQKVENIVNLICKESEIKSNKNIVDNMKKVLLNNKAIIKQISEYLDMKE